MENLSAFRLNSYTEIKQLLSSPEGAQFEAYLRDVYLFLMRMNPMDFISVRKDVAPENYCWFIKSCCLFIWDGNTDFIFSNDYAFLRRSSFKDEDQVAKYHHLLKEKKRRHELESATRINRKKD